MKQSEIRVSKHVQTDDVYIRQDSDTIVIEADKLNDIIQELKQIQMLMPNFS